MTESKPTPILDGIPENERVMFCQRCLVEQLIEVLDLVERNGVWLAPIQCKACGSIVSRLVHTPGQGWDLDMSFYKERRIARKVA